MCRPSDFQSEPNRTAGHARPVHATLSGSLHLFCHDRFHCYPQPGNVYAAIRVFTSVPLLFISGISWPGAAIPPFWKYFSYVFPSTFGINGFVRINNMGGTLSEVAFEYKALWLQAGFYFLTTCLVYRWQIIMSRKHIIERYKELKERERMIQGE